MRLLDLSIIAVLAATAAAAPNPTDYQNRHQSGGPIDAGADVSSALTQKQVADPYELHEDGAHSHSSVEVHLDKRQDAGPLIVEPDYNVLECRRPNWQGGCINHPITDPKGTCIERHYERIPNSMKPDPGLVCELFDGPNCKNPGGPSMTAKEFVYPGVANFLFDDRLTRAHFDNGPASLLCMVWTTGGDCSVCDPNVVQGKPDTKYKWNEDLD